MDKYQETFNTWNKVARQYQDKFMDLELYNDSYDLICTSVKKPHAKILEIGCGPGNISKYLLSKRPDFSILGIDIAPAMIELARINNPAARFAVSDSRNIDAIHEKFDGIVCGFVLPYLSQADTRKLIADCHHLLTEGGLLYLSFVEGDPAASGFRSAGSGGRCFFYFHHPDDIKTQLADNGFTVPEIYKVPCQRSATQAEIHTIVISHKLINS